MASKTSPAKPSCSGPEHVSVSMRKISNGYVVSTSHSKGDVYKSSETFHPKKPNLELPKAATGPVRGKK